ncbi:hypothetical protein PQO01_02730 [Lentisphaera marina]|uniref:hypothetical protein n=1 Tax=Lentisphaera marina TaxID=1111041 RepID=UPI002366F584|nr:hypothetical protein [Lentisphaera marina]MDD7983863.1 hypothetical protein [Lentisphaera marina]
MKLKTIKTLKSLGLKLTAIWFAFSAYFIYTSIDMALKGKIPKGFLASQILVANVLFFLAGFVFYFSWQFWIKLSLRKNGLDGLLNR